MKKTKTNQMAVGVMKGEKAAQLQKDFFLLQTLNKLFVEHPNERKTKHAKDLYSIVIVGYVNVGLAFVCGVHQTGPVCLCREVNSLHDL